MTGSSPRAEDGTLTIMVGGEESDVERVRPLLEIMGELIVYAGPLGSGQAVKLINNAVAAANAATLAQALLVGSAQGLDLDALVDVMAAGSGASTMLTLKAGPMRTHDYTTLFKTEHMLKDVRLCLEEAQEADVAFPAAAAACDALSAAVARGHGSDGLRGDARGLRGLRGPSALSKNSPICSQSLGIWGGFGTMRVVPSHGSRWISVITGGIVFCCLRSSLPSYANCVQGMGGHRPRAR